MKRISSSPTRAVSSTIFAVVVVIAIIVASLGTYAALGTGKATVTSTITSTAVSTTTKTVTVTANGGQTTTSSSTSASTSSSPFTYPATLPSLTVLEAGSSLVYPVFELWAPAFHTMYPNVQVNTAAGGSGSGQSGAEKGTLQLGASDAYLTDAQHAAYPFILNIPLAISAQQVMYNIPGLPATMHLNFSGSVLAGIYNGSIAYWNNPAITAINPGATQYLTNQPIIPIHRSDGSGDTFLFTSYLSSTSASWNKTVGFATSVNWPSNPAALAANGNTGMVTACAQNKYSIAYIGVSYLASAVAGSASQTPLGYAYLQNRAGNFVNISTSNIQAAAAAMVPSTPADERISMIYAPGANSYPIINYEYVMVAQNQTTPGMALTLRTLLTWIIDSNHGNSPQFLNAVSFIPLPASTVQLTLSQIAKISGP